MGSRRCCSCSTTVRCEGCCSDCMVSYTLERKGYLLESGSPYGIDGDSTNPLGNADPIMPQVPGDEVILHFGSVHGDADGIGRIGIAPVQQTYKNIGSFWTWYPPAFMVDFNQHFPSCTTLELLNLNIPGGDVIPSDPCFSKYTTPGSSIQTGDLDNYCYPFNNSPDDLCGTISNSNGYRCAHGGQACGTPKFDTISIYDPYDGGYPGQIFSPIFGGIVEPGEENPTPDAVDFRVGGSVSFKQSYPCSTPAEDKCCRYNSGSLYPDRIITGVEFSDMHIAGPFGNIIQNKPEACNYLGLTKYRRRMLKTFYPWAWQIFSYSLDKLLPFGNPTYHWAGTGEGSRLVRVGQQQSIPNSNGLFWTSLRFQFLGFAFCEHHYDSACGCFYKDSSIRDEVIFGRYIPRRLMFACSGIPMFEFDIYEAYKDGILPESDTSPARFIELWKSFTTWRINPNRNLTEYYTPSTDFLGGYGFIAKAVDPRAVPSVEEIEEMRGFLNGMTSRKYSGLRSTDWRYQATLDIITANDLYKEAIRKRNLLIDPEDDTEVEFDIIQQVGGFNFTIDELRANPKQYCREIFPKPLGPVRKRCRMINAPVSSSPLWNQSGDGELVTLTSKHGVNVLVPKTFPLTNNIEPEYVVDSDFIDLQAIRWFDIGKPYLTAQSGSGNNQIPKFNGNLQPPDLENYPDINWTESELAQDLNNNLSHLMYTYFYTQPNGWDWIGYGPQLNGNKPENNWFSRKFGTTPSGVVNDVFSYTNPHTPLSRMTRGSLEYSWNPNARAWFRPTV